MKGMFKMKEHKISPIIIRKPEVPNGAINMITPFDLDSPNAKIRHKLGIYAKTLTYQSIDIDIDRDNGEVTLDVPDIREEIKDVHTMLYDLSNDREYHDRVSMDILFVDYKDEYVRSAVIARNCIPIEKIGNIEKIESKLSEEVKSGIRYLVRTEYIAILPLTFSCEIVDEIDGKSAVDIANDYLEEYIGYIKPKEDNK